jgi:hypothetical protein
MLLSRDVVLVLLFELSKLSSDGRLFDVVVAGVVVSVILIRFLFISNLIL